jgi:3-oxoacyl-[acyl-carrier protein] reductase
MPILPMFISISLERIAAIRSLIHRFGRGSGRRSNSRALTGASRGVNELHRFFQEVGMRLKDRVAVITGGGQGIGRAYALRFAKEGAKIVVAEINENNGETVAEEIRKSGGDAAYVKADVGNEDSCKQMAATAHERFGRIDILLNNAAIFYGLDRTDQSLQYFNRILSVNLTGTWLATRACEPYMKRQRSGKIINQSSTAAFMGNVGMVDTSDPDLPSPPFHYSVAKMGVNGLTKYFAGALGPWGINVNAIAPGVTMTEATRSVVPEEMISMLVMYTALKKPLQPDDLTGTAVFLASEDSDLMTGQVLVVDGGMIMLG